MQCLNNTDKEINKLRQFNKQLKKKFTIKDFLSKCDQIQGKLRIWSNLLKKSLMENFIFCKVLRKEKILHTVTSQLFYYVVVIARCRVQYGKYFPSLSYFITYFMSLQVSEIIEKYERRRNYFPILHEATCDNYFIFQCLLKSNTAKIILLTYQFLV